MSFEKAAEELKAAFEEDLKVPGVAVNPRLRSAALAFIAEGLGELVNGPRMIANAIDEGFEQVVEALESLGETVERVHEVLERMSPPPQLDLETQLPIPPIPTRMELLQERLVASVEHYVEGKLHTVGG